MCAKMNANFQLGEVKLKVSQLERSISFYEDVVGFKVLRKDNNQAFLTADGKTTLVILEEIEDAIVTQPRTSSGLYHFAILLPTRKALGSFLRNLTQKGIYIGQADHLVSEALYISDPDHNGIEIYRDRPRHEWKHDLDGHVSMASDPIHMESLLEEAKDMAWDGLPGDTTIGHVHLHVSDLMASKRFYCDILGFDLTANWPGALFISAGGYHHHLGLNTWAGEGAPQPPANATGLSYYTMTVPEQSDLDAMLLRLASAGIAVQTQEGASFVNDPSGNAIKLAVH